MQSVPYSNSPFVPFGAAIPATSYPVGTVWEDSDLTKWSYPQGVWATFSGPAYSNGDMHYLNNGAAGLAVLANPVYGSGLKVYENTTNAQVGAKYQYRPWTYDNSGAWASFAEVFGGSGTAKTLTFPAPGYYDIQVVPPADPAFYTVVDKTEVI